MGKPTLYWFLYNLAGYLLLPFALLKLYWRGMRLPGYRQRIGERFGRIDGASPGGLWVHAVSVGELVAIAPVIHEFAQRCPQTPITLTVTTPTGAKRARELVGAVARQYYFPFDLRPFMRRLIDRLQPRLVVVVETEVWPNMLALLAARRTPVMLVNARLSSRSARGYRLLRPFAEDVFRRFAKVAAQTREDARRFVELGVAETAVQVTGSIKFDLHMPASVREQAEVIRAQWNSSRPVWVAASTHEGEEQILLDVQCQLLRQDPATLLVLAPRHPERGRRIAQWIEPRQLRYAQRSLRQNCLPDTQVYLLDTIGELAMYMAAADLVFVGGSLSDNGGHNILEPAMLAKPVLFGPSMRNFLQISRILLARQAAIEVQDGKQLLQVLEDLLHNASLRVTLGENGRRAVLENQGATGRLMELMLSCWDGLPGAGDCGDR
jgi:3-deoxy-D-manno-octulosonic-acid transferase